MRLKMAYNVVTLTILFESTPKRLLQFQNGTHVDNSLPELMHLRIQLDTYEYRPQVSYMDPSSQGPSIYC